ncbi:MAG: hypothetical protein NWE83_11030 [Candidatus Bathyarchaeota archaeon]|nr:hypothetical protein [Candidatus Bathyarchaeota archaeon]
MPYCAICQAHRPDPAVFCPECGQRLEPPPLPSFDINVHLQQLQQHGWLRIKLRQDSDKTKPRRYKQEAWNATKYLEDIWRALNRGGFSYFTHIGEEHQETFTTGVILTTKHAITSREKAPILLPTERLQKVADIQTKSATGQLCFTGHRFLYQYTMLEMAMSRSDEVGKHFIYTHPLLSIWIKPDFTELLQLTRSPAIRETGTFRKKQYRRMTFRVNEVKRPRRRQPHAVFCGYLWDGPDGSHVDEDAQYAFATPDPLLSAEQFALELRELIRQAKPTPITDLIAYTYHCHARPDALIATDPSAGIRHMQEHPYAHWSTFPIIV